MSYHLFMGSYFYPNPGIEDYQGGFDSVAEIIAVIKKLALEKHFQWAQIVELIEGDYINASWLKLHSRCQIQLLEETVNIKWAK